MRYGAKGHHHVGGAVPKAKQTGRSQKIGLSQPGGSRWRFCLMILLSFNMMASVESQTPACDACLFFVANMEGASVDRVLDIFNGCGHSVRLDEYLLCSCSNGCVPQNFHEHHENFTSGAVLQAGATWRIAHPQARIPPGARPWNQTYQYLSNGNDAFALVRRSPAYVLDTVGDFGPDPGAAGWTVAGVPGATVDHTLIRKNTTSSGNCGAWSHSAGTSAASSEWMVYPQGTWPFQASPSNTVSPSSPSSPSSCPSPPSAPCSLSSVITKCGPSAPVTASAALDRRPDRSRLVVATWNAEWLFDGVCDPTSSPWAGGTECVGHASGLNRCDAAGAAAHLQRMAARMAAFDADVISLVEIESCAMLDAVGAVQHNPNGGASGAAYESLMTTGTDTFLRQQVGLLSRLRSIAPVERSSARQAYPIDGASGCGDAANGTSDTSKHYVARLHLELPAASGAAGSTEAATLIVVGMHLKAIPTDPPSCHKREAQARVMQPLLATALAESDYVIALGDLNDFDGDACCRDAANSTPTSRVLRMLKDPDRDGTDELHSVVQRMPQAQRYTDWWDHAPADGVEQGATEHSSLDHMLVSTALFERLVSVRIDHTTAPMDYSDHWPIIATFDLGPRLSSPLSSSPPSPTGGCSDAKAAPSEADKDHTMMMAGILILVLSCGCFLSFFCWGVWKGKEGAQDRMLERIGAIQTRKRSNKTSKARAEAAMDDFGGGGFNMEMNEAALAASIK